MGYQYIAGGGTAPASPTQVTPADYISVIDSTPRFEFNCPTDPDNSRVTFAIEVDTVNTFDSGNLMTIESRFSHTDEDNHGYWDYDSDGAGNFAILDSAGILTATYSGRKIRASFPTTKALKAANYYWRILVSDNLIYSPSNVLNQFLLGQGEIDT